MLEPDALNSVCQLDVDAQIVRVELEAVIVTESAVFADVHRECGDLALERQLPVPVLGRMSFKRHSLSD